MYPMSSGPEQKGVTVKVLGWDEERYNKLPQVLRDHIDSCRALLVRERDPEKVANKNHYREGREVLESQIPFSPEILQEVDRAREEMVSVAIQFLASCVPLDFLKNVLKNNGMEMLAHDSKICEEIQLKVVEDAVTQVRLALLEAFMNHLKHGLQGDPRGTIEGRANIVHGVAKFFSKDSGLGFDPNDVPDATKDENLEKTSGRGLMWMKLYLFLTGWS